MTDNYWTPDRVRANLKQNQLSGEFPTGAVKIDRLEIAGDAIMAVGTINGNEFRGQVAIIVDDDHGIRHRANTLVLDRASAEQLVENWQRYHQDDPPKQAVVAPDATERPGTR